MCSHQVSNCTVRPPCGRCCFRPAMALSRNEQGPQRLRSVTSSDNLTLENSFEDNGVSRQLVLDMFTSESDVFQRCLSPQQAPQRCRGSTGACHLLRDLAATADLPPHRALFSQQLLDLTNRWWSETEDPDIDVNDVYLLAAAACTCINCTPQGTLIRLHFSFQIRGSQPAPSPTFSRLSLVFSTASQRSTVAFTPGGHRGSSLRPFPSSSWFANNFSALIKFAQSP